MGFLTSIRSSLVLISFTAISIILWLSVSFWHTAYVERLDAAQLSESIESEDLMYDSARELVRQRSLVHLMLSSIQPASKDDLKNLNSLQTKTNASIENIRTSTSAALTNKPLLDRFTFVDSEIRIIFRDLVSIFLKLSNKEERIAEQAELSLSERDKNFKDSTFADFSTLIESTHLLRSGTHFVPRHNALDIDHLQALRIANWHFSEAIAREASLMSSVLASGRYLQEEERKEVESLHIETLATWKNLQQYRAKRGALPELSAKIEEVEKIYLSDFVNLLNLFFNDSAPPARNSMTLEHWLSVEKRTTSLLDQLDQISSVKIKNVAMEVEQRAVRNLIIDSTIVLICLLIGIAVIGVLQKIRHMATHDDLTGLPNRIYFEDLLDATIDVSEPKPVAVLYIDLDGFKHVNDTFGHDIGDKLLQQVSSRMTTSIAKRGTVSRHGGDEFSVIISEYAERDTAFYISNMLLEALEPDFDIDGFIVRAGASIGISFYPEDANSADELKRNADFAMYYAKSQGRGRVYAFNQDLASEYQSRLQIKDDLKKAIDENQFELAYQPQVGIESQTVQGLEALIRWQHPAKGFIPPDVFISIAEESGQIHDIGDWVLDEACRQMAAWHKNGLANMQIAVNVSAKQFMRPDFIDFVEQTYQRHQLDPSCLELEITESVLVTDVQQVIDTCHRLQKMKIKLAIDDFGTGYSSLSYLQDLPVDTLKIDRAFITGIDNVTSKSVARTIVMLAQSCGLETVAEGVETKEQADMIAELGCDYIQGYFYSKPVSSDELLQHVASINDYCQNNERAA